MTITSDEAPKVSINTASDEVKAENDTDGKITNDETKVEDDSDKIRAIDARYEVATEDDADEISDKSLTSNEVIIDSTSDEASESSVSQVAIDTNLGESSDSITSAVPHEVKTRDSNSENLKESVKLNFGSETNDDTSSDRGTVFSDSASGSSEDSSKDSLDKNDKVTSAKNNVKLPWNYYFMSYNKKVNYVTSKIQNTEDLDNLNQKSRDKLTKQLSRLGKKIRRAENGHLMARSFFKTYHESDFNKDALKTLNQVSQEINS